MVLGEIAPKSLAVQAPDKWALLLAPFINFCAVLFAPLSWLVVRVAGVLVRPFGAKAEFEQPMITKEELEHIINEGEERGQLDSEEQVILKNVFDLTETIVRKVMTPRRDMTAVPVEADLQAVLSTILDSGHSRVPVYEGTTDNIVGIVHAKDLLPLLRSEDPPSQMLDLRHTMRAATFVPEGKSVLELLNEFRLSNQQVAIIKDEYGGTEGLVTIEDLLEEIVGPIHDEYDRDEPTIVPVSDGEWRIEGRQTIGDVNDALGTDLPESETYDTISGWIFNQLGREPLPGDHARSDDFEFIVEQVEGMRIHSLRALRIVPAGADNGDEPTAAPPTPALSAPDDRNARYGDNGARASDLTPSNRSADEKPAAPAR
jgi:putative hemolysin